MRILMINYEYPPLGGGGGKQSMYLASEYAKKHKVYFLTAGYGKYGVSKENGFMIHRVKCLRKKTDKAGALDMLSFVVSAWRAVPSVVKRFKPDFVHIFFTIPTGLLVFHPSMKGLKTIVSVRGSDVPGHNPERFKVLYKVMTPLAKAVWKRSVVVCNSEDLKKEVLLFDSSLKVHVIPNGVDTEKFKPVEVLSTGKPVLLYVGRLIPLKRIDLLIKQLPADMSLRVVGSGSEEGYLKKIAYGHSVTFVGEVAYDHIQDEFHKADIYVQLSKVEGMSNTILEAMASGLPVITTNVGGAKKLIDGNGVVLDKASRLGDALKKIDVERMGRRSREIALDYGFDKVADAYLGLVL